MFQGDVEMFSFWLFCIVHAVSMCIIIIFRKLEELILFMKIIKWLEGLKGIKRLFSPYKFPNK